MPFVAIATGSLAGIGNVEHGTADYQVAIPESHPIEVKADPIEVEMKRYNATSDTRFLHRAIKSCNKLLQADSLSADERASVTSRLGQILLTRYQRTKDVQDIKAAIDNFRAALASDGPRRPSSVLQLVEGLQIFLGDAEDPGLQGDIQKEIQELLVESRRVPSRQSTIVTSTIDQEERGALESDIQDYIYMGDIGLLNKVIEKYKMAFASANPNQPADVSAMRSTLGLTLYMRYMNLRQKADLDEAQSHLVAAEESATDVTVRARSLSDLGRILCDRFTMDGNSADIENSISYHEEALKLTDRPSSQLLRTHYLADALQARFDYFGDISDVNAIIERLVPILASIGVSSPPSDLAAAHSSLGHAYNTRYLVTQDEDDINASIQSYEAALQLMTLPDMQASLLTNYAMALQGHPNYNAPTMNGDDHRSRVILAHCQALQITKEDHPDRALRLAHYGNALRHGYSFSKTRFANNLEDALLKHREALKLVPEGSPDRAMHLRNLGITLMAYHHSGLAKGLVALEEGIGALRSAMTLETAPVAVRFGTAITLGTLMSAQYLSTSYLAFTMAISLLPRMAWLGSNLGSRQQALKEPLAMALPSDAAVVAIRLGYFAGAVELLEAGRSIFWTQSLQLRTPMSDLQVVDPKLASEIEDVSSRLEKSTQLVTDEETNRQRRELAIRWEALVSQARQLPGLERFMRTKEYQHLSEAAVGGACIVLNVNKKRTDALIVGRMKRSSHVPLPDANLERIQVLAARLHVVLSSSDFGRRRGSRQVRKTQPSEDLYDLLAELWNGIMAPVIQALDFDQFKSRPRLWLCPTGLLSQLPLHAAGIYKDGSQEYLSNYAIVSYTPTLSALLSARAPRANPRPTQVLAIGQGAPSYKLRPLPGVEEELTRIISLSQPGSVTLVQGNEATQANVLNKLDGATWFHVASHGIQDLQQPLNSALLLADGPLKLSSLIERRLGHGEFAFLSACETAMGDEALSNESMHLAAGFLSGGVSSVVATLWSIRDEDGPTVAEEFYRHMLYRKDHPDHTESALALDKAIRVLRDNGVSPFRWVPFIHMGA